MRATAPSWHKLAPVREALRALLERPMALGQNLKVTHGAAWVELALTLDGLAPLGGPSVIVDIRGGRSASETRALFSTGGIGMSLDPDTGCRLIVAAFGAIAECSCACEACTRGEHPKCTRIARCSLAQKAAAAAPS